ncbi:MAG: molecular chaperone HtpG [Paludibacteraceae bacterium]|nr:molecular chaperone HtpG [Paludibacteraceae bacterium]
MAQGNIGVTSDNIFPVIKKFLYSDHEIFLRELVSNAVDATQKLKTLSSVGEFKGELGDTKVRVSIDKVKGTLTVSDHGIGMTAEEVDKYINQIAFSGAEEFLDKYKDNAQAIIGHFGLGFYSAFMVSKKVEIVSLSYKDDAKAVHWTCDGSPVYEMEDTIKAERGTDIILHIDDENKEFLEDSRIQSLLTKYCKFLPVEIVFGKKKEWKDGLQVDTEEDNVINNPSPAWTRKPEDLKDEDYDAFYHELYPTSMEQPLFHIHLNVDYPFHLTGILYFPKIKPHMDVKRDKIQLYCNQVFVTDEVENIVPEYLTLLHGVIDSPDIPLNVSRSYLQSDANVKKISGHITKKVTDALADMFRANREEFEGKWNDIKIFVQYGMLSDEKFYERAEKFCLLESVDHKFRTFDEYKELTEKEQTDKEGTRIYLYANDVDNQYTFIQRAKEKGYDVLLCTSPLDVHAMAQLEQKWEQKVRFVRVDSDIIENLIRKADTQAVTLTDEQKRALNSAFSSQLPTLDKARLNVTFEQADSTALPVFVTQDEWMRRMKDMSRLQGGMSFYGDMPDSYNIVVNTAHPLVASLVEKTDAAGAAEAHALYEQQQEKQAEISKIDEANKDKKYDEISQEDKDRKKALQDEVRGLEDKQSKIYADFAATEPRFKQLIDIALLAGSLLKGEQLAAFVNRSVELL